MSLHLTRLSRRSLCFAYFLLASGVAGSKVYADPIYAITDLGTLNGQTSSVPPPSTLRGRLWESLIIVPMVTSPAELPAMKTHRFDETGNGSVIPLQQQRNDQNQSYGRLAT